MTTGHISSGLCHLGNIAYRTTGHLTVEADKPNLGLMGEAANLLTREYRAPWELPAV